MSQYNPSPNNIPPTMGVTDDANLTPISLRVDPTTYRLKTQTTISGSTSILDRFKTNDVAVSGAVTYVGSEDADGVWMVTKIDETSGTVIRYATIVNNVSTSDYSTAWTNRASLSYGYYSVAF